MGWMPGVGLTFDDSGFVDDSGYIDDGVIGVPPGMDDGGFMNPTGMDGMASGSRHRLPRRPLPCRPSSSA